MYAPKSRKFRPDFLSGSDLYLVGDTGHVNDNPMMSKRWLPIINGTSAVWLEATREVVSHLTSQGVLSVLRVSEVKWFSAVLSPRRQENTEDEQQKKVPGPGREWEKNSLQGRDSALLIYQFLSCSW